MRTKRKRADEPVTPNKYLKVSSSGERSIGSVSHNVLSFCYIEVHTLRRFLLDHLPPSSRARRRKIRTHGVENDSNFLDTTLIGISITTRPALEEERQREFVAFTQSQERHSHTSSGVPEEDRLSEVRSD